MKVFDRVPVAPLAVRTERRVGEPVVAHGRRGDD
jgi:hypothetical protein